MRGAKLSYMPSSKEYNRRYYRKNREACIARVREWQVRMDYKPHIALRQEMLKAYGEKCACCDEDIPEFLQLDHVGGGGEADRAQYGGHNAGVIRRLKTEGWPKDSYRLLCANCNIATANGRICPHQK